MSFKSIGELCRDVIGEAETAAHAGKLRTELNTVPTSGGASTVMTDVVSGMRMGGAPLREEGESEAPIAQASLEEPMASKLNEKVRGRAPAVQSKGLGDGARGEMSRAEYGPAPVLRLIVSNTCLGTATPAAANGRSPRPAVSRHLVLVSGHMRMTP